MNHLNLALEMVREMKSELKIVDGLDVADNSIQEAMEERELMIHAINCLLGHMTGNMDGDWDVSPDPVEYARSVLSKVL